jgi:exosortase
MVLIGTVFYWEALKGLWELVGKSSLFSYIPFVPFISAALLCWRRGRIHVRKSSSLSYWGLLIMVLAGAFFLLVKAPGIHPASPEMIWIGVLSLVVFIWGAFITAFGSRSFGAVLFPMGFLLFAVPLPQWALDPVISVLVRGSTEVVDLLFRILVVPFAREGRIFHLPSFSIEVADNCSGIRSTMVLVMLTSVAGYVFLKRKALRFLLIICIIPIALLKNGIRVVTISIMAELLGEAFFRGWLHRSGGIVFFLLALGMTVPIVYGLRKMDTSSVSRHKTIQEV